MLFLVDGYNLMHATGSVPPRMKPGRLKAARTRFLDWLADTPGGRNRSSAVRVVFDAQNGYGPSADGDHRGILVRYAVGETADDLIERLLLAEPVPGRVAVVSNDNRVREAARRRGSAGWACEAFVDWLLSGGTTPTGQMLSPAVEKPDGPIPADEKAELLEAFTIPKPRGT